jgi:hypothetical protein
MGATLNAVGTKAATDAPAEAGAHVVGIKPWFPWPLGRWRWLTEPVPAERLAALRIGLAAALLVDLLTTYWPHVEDYFTRRSLGGWVIFNYLWTRTPGLGRWTLLADVDDPAGLRAAMLLWIAATVCLLLGLLTRLSAAVAWALSISFMHLNGYIYNAGDEIRGIILFYLMIAPSGAAWSVDAWLRRRRAGAVLIYPWALRLLFLQFVLIYFLNGLYKVVHEDWRSGNTLYYALADLTLARFSYAQFPVPYGMTRVMTWSVLAWELGFPLWVALPWTRKPALFMGVLFHLGIFCTMELGSFVPYILTLYLPLLPWERWRRGRAAAPALQR